jgi:macrolide transport system ATP-binding/permease protein
MDKKTKASSKAIEGRGRHGKSEGSKQKSLHSAAKNIEQRMEALENIAVPERLRAVRFRQSKAIELHNKFPIAGNDVRIAFGDNILLDGATFTIPLGAKVAFVGGNGTGKTSLFKMIMNKDHSLTISPKAVIGYFEQQGYKFSKEQTVIDFIQENCDYSVSEIRAVLASMGFGSTDIHKSLSVISGGEIIKLHLSKMLMGHFNILLMDEPGNFLDISSIEALEQMMKSYAGTILFITHDSKLVENVADIIYKIESKKLIRIEDKFSQS